MRVSEAESRLVQMLANAGINGKAATLSQVWSVYMAFARIAVVDEDEVQILAQWGTYDFYLGRRTFQFDLTRQFTLYRGDEYGGMEQLRCTLFFEPTPALTAVEGNMWSMDYPSLETFFASVEHQPAFKQVIALGLPIEMQVGQEKV